MKQDLELLSVDYDAPNASELFVKSLRNTGFCVLKNHPIERKTIESIYSRWQNFFDGEDKNTYLFNSDNQDGFFPVDISETAKGNNNKDIKEFFHFYPWGRCPEQLKNELDNYYKQASVLASKLLFWVEKEVPKDISTMFSEPLPNMINGSYKTLLRILHYPPMKENEIRNSIRAAEHEDINLLTLLPASNRPGLQVKSRTGEWIDVPCEYGQLIINTGDMLQEATRGYLPSTTHRVINPMNDDVNASRISIPLFLHPRPDVILSPRYTADTYLHERLYELGLKA